MSFGKKILKLVLITFLLSSIFYLLSSKTYASEEFETTYEINYNVNLDASISVEQKVNLTNKLANVYATQYQITLGTTRIRSVWAKTELEELTPELEKKENTTTIKINFGQKVVGKAKTLSFTLGYTSDDYAFKNGRILEIGIPKIAEEGISDYKIFLNVPYVFEDPAFIYPEPVKIIPSTKTKTYFFNKDRLLNQSITAAFGNFQVFNFNLKYHLTNENVHPANFKIALPPDTAYQKIYYENIDPQPLNVEVDIDGNWLASYLLQPKEKLDILAKGAVKLFIAPQNDLARLSNPQDYLSAQKYWEVDNDEIKKIAQQLKTAENIYHYVAQNLLYDYARVEQKPHRLGAVNALKNKNSAICMEFTDLFIALARAAKIPAREINGFAYTNNPQLRPLSLKQDVLHSWPQYYDWERKLWINIDPTWDNTTGGIDFFHKLDLNHFTFAIHGMDSEFPLPAGSYKNEEEGKDIEINFGTSINPRLDFKLEINLPEKIISGLALRGTVTINNTGNIALYNQDLTLSSADLKIDQQKFSLSSLPPFANFKQNIFLSKTNLLTAGEKEIIFEFADQKFIQKVTVHSFFPSWFSQFLVKTYSLLSLLRQKLTIRIR